MLTKDRVYEYAQNCARTYCAKHSAWGSFDDATSAAALYLLEHPEKWDQENAGLKTRVVGELERQYQNEHGLRRKHMPKRVDIDVERLAVRKRPPSSVRPDCERMTIIQRALRQPGIARYAYIIEDILSLKYTKGEIAKRHGISGARVSQIYREFKSVCRRLDPERAVAIVDTTREDPTAEELEAAPLFYHKQSERATSSTPALASF